MKAMPNTRLTPAAMIRNPIFALAFGLAAGTVNGQALATNSPQPAIDQQTEKKWTFSASLYTYLVPDDQEYLQPTFTADRGWLHLEARYNYEALETGSAWVGYNFGGGEKLSWEFTPMLGGVFRDTTGVAPGYRGSLSWWKLELSSEGEYVFDAGDQSDNFFYTWSELSLAPVDWFRFGLVTQRTRLYKSDRDIERGLLVGFSYKKLDLTTYVFDADGGRPLWVVGVSHSF